MDASLLEQDRKLGLLLMTIGVGFIFCGVLFVVDPAFIALGSFAMVIGKGYFQGFREFFKDITADGVHIAAALGYVFGVVLMLNKHVLTGLMLDIVAMGLIFKPLAYLLKVGAKLLQGAGALLRK